MKKIWIAMIMVSFVCLVGCTQKDNTTIDENKVSPEQSSTVSQNSEKQEVKNEDNISDSQEAKDNEETKNTEEVKVQPSPIITSIKDEKPVIVPKEGNDGITVLKFKNTNSNETISALNGKQVSITGYISTLSPLNGEFAYLMNMPYQSCPFCVPGTSAINNTLAIYAGNKSKIKFTDQPVTVVGTLETGNFTDDFGYEYGVRLNNVTVKKADIDKLSDTVKKYNLLAENGVVGQIYESIMTADASVFYNYYRMEKPEKIALDGIKATKSSIDTYNSKGDYDNLVNVMNDLISLCEEVNGDIGSGDYSKFNEYQPRLQNIYCTFAMWMAEGEL